MRGAKRKRAATGDDADWRAPAGGAVRPVFFLPARAAVADDTRDEVDADPGRVLLLCVPREPVAEAEYARGGGGGDARG